MSPEDKASALNEAALEVFAEVARTVFDSPDPAGALSRLLRHARRERAFGISPAAMTHEEIVGARTAGIPLQIVAARTRHRPQPHSEGTLCPRPTNRPTPNSSSPASA